MCLRRSSSICADTAMVGYSLLMQLRLRGPVRIAARFYNSVMENIRDMA
ncbi:hypothetical protein BVG79_00376 [Ketogulonicigenium robustum]|uniref:Uncharacterized protein n=1 Tax=Ketogulonicigenium robustum TaxID=92947 RepID=A0A1W6NWX0_9RHOB|nr:hypothetical protein BVG79_00376 [Ketogulonicigenium robustum]